MYQTQTGAVEPLADYRIDSNPMRYSQFVPRLYGLCLGLGMEQGRIMPSRAFCSDESQGYPVILLAKHFGAFPFNHGQVGGIVATDRHGPHAHHGQDLVILQASHVGYDADTGTFGVYRRLQSADHECTTSCGKICGVIDWHAGEYRFAQDHILVARGELGPVVIVDNLLVRQDREEGLMLHMPRLVRFDADALDASLPAFSPLPLLQSIHLSESGQTIALDVGPRYVGPPVEPGYDMYGCRYGDVDYGTGVYSEVVYHPLAQYTSVDEIADTYTWPTPDWFDYSGVKAAAVALLDEVAARAGVRPSLEMPRLYADVNVTGTVTLLEHSRAFKVPKFIFGSSSSIYGNSDTVPFSESAPSAEPVSPYAASKRAGELLAYAFHHLYGINVSCLRFFTVYGPRQRPEMAIHKFTRRIEQGEEVPIFGDGSSARDYTYVDDIVGGVVAAIDKAEGYQVFNLGRSEVVTLRDLVGHIEKALGKKARVAVREEQPGDVRQTCADVSRARRILGYEPRVGIQEGIRRFVDWYRAQPRP